MTRIAAMCSLLALAGCASSSVRERLPEYRDGLGPDLRVFSDDSCLADAPAAVRGGSLGGELVKGVASLAVKSFGRFLEEVGSPEIETAYGIHADMFFDAESSPPILNPGLRCLYIVRDGFQTRSFDKKAPERMRNEWTRLGLSGTPSLYAFIRLDPAGDGTNHFKATMFDFAVQRPARPGAESSRDYVIFMEFVIPSSGRQYSVSQKGEIEFKSTGPFGRGGIALRGARIGSYMQAAELRGVETGWMTGPSMTDIPGQRPVNLYVDVVEMKQGNAFIADLGRFLQSPAIADAAGNEARALVDTEDKERADVAAGVEAEKIESRFAFALETQILAIRDTLADAKSSKSALLAAAQKTESAIADIEFQRRQKGWRSAYPDALIADARTLAGQARTRVNTQ